jgi:hypothetical protein
MSEPMTNLEIEDVLSSIRRLVSEEAELPAKPVSRAAERFVLTPAFRVEVPDPTLDVSLGTTLESQENTIEGDSATADQRATRSVDFDVEFNVDYAASDDREIVDARSLDDLLNPAWPPSASDEDVASIESSLAGALAGEEIQSDELPGGREQRPYADPVEPDTQNSTEPWPPAVEHDQQDKPVDVWLGRRAVEIETAVDDVQGEWEPDGSEPEVAERPERHIFASTRAAAEMNRSQGLAASSFMASQTFAPEVAPASGDTTMSGDSDAEVAQTELDWPDPGRADAGDTIPADRPDEAKIVPDAADKVINPTANEIFVHAVIENMVKSKAESAAKAALENLVEVEDAPATTDETHETHEKIEPKNADHTDDDSNTFDAEILDQSTLHELVASIVREELQGDLGERITRNVRRMVRREIQRALSLKDFD